MQKKNLLLFLSGISAPQQVWYPQGTVMDATLASENFQIQEPNVLYEGGVFKMWYSGGYDTTPSTIHYATSTDGYQWTKSGTVLSGYTRSFVLKNGTTYVLYALGAGGLCQFTSADGINWTLAASGVLSHGAVWDTGIANICVWIEGSTWHMIYEAGDGSVYRLGYATSTDGGQTFTKQNGGNYVLQYNGGTGSISGPFVVKVGSTYWMWAHAATTSALPTDITRWRSMDLINWTQSPAGLALPRTAPDEGHLSGAGQVADVSIVEALGKTWAFYAAYQSGSGAFGHINVATANYPISTLVHGSEGVDAAYRPNWLQNPGGERAGAGGADVFAFWTENVGTGAIAQTSTAGEFRSGERAFKVTAGSSANTTITQSISTVATVLGAGNVYTFSGWARGDGTNGPRIRAFSTAVNDLLTPAIPVLSASTTWTQFSYNLTIPASGNITFYLYCPSANGGVGYFDDVSLRRVG